MNGSIGSRWGCANGKNFSRLCFRSETIAAVVKSHLSEHWSYGDLGWTQQIAYNPPYIQISVLFFAVSEWCEPFSLCRSYAEVAPSCLSGSVHSLEGNPVSNIFKGSWKGLCHKMQGSGEFWGTEEFCSCAVQADSLKIPRALTPFPTLQLCPFLHFILGDTSSCQHPLHFWPSVLPWLSMWLWNTVWSGSSYLVTTDEEQFILRVLPPQEHVEEQSCRQAITPPVASRLQDRREKRAEWIAMTSFCVVDVLL